MFINSLFKRKLKKMYRVLDELQQLIFAIYVNHDYPENHYLYEKDIHELRWQFFYLVKKTYSLLNAATKKKRQQLLIPLKKVEETEEIITSFGSLRYRIKDHTTFEVCDQEFTQLAKSISVNLISLSKSKKNIQSILPHIHAVESIFRNTLQLVLNDPVIFLIFIQNLYSLEETNAT